MAESLPEMRIKYEFKKGEYKISCANGRLKVHGTLRWLLINKCDHAVCVLIDGPGGNPFDPPNSSDGFVFDQWFPIAKDGEVHALTASSGSTGVFRFTLDVAKKVSDNCLDGVRLERGQLEIEIYP